MQVPEILLDTLRRENRFIIASHINPEGDALGTTIALYLALKKMGKDVFAFNVDGIPYLYEFLPSSGVVQSKIEGINTVDYSLLLVDCNEPDRAGLKDRSFKRHIVIDHHLTEKDFGDLKWIEPEAPATGIMAYYLIKALGVEIDREIAENLYTAISIDTGTFRYDNTTAETLRVAADLIEKGADPSRVAICLYESWRANRFRLLIKMLETMELKEVGSLKIALTYISLDMFEQTGTTQADTENFSNFPRMIDEVDVSVMFRETERGKWKASMRSKGRLNLAEVAAVLGGGGHRNAAGFKADGELAELKKRLLETISRVQQKNH